MLLVDLLLEFHNKMYMYCVHVLTCKCNATYHINTLEHDYYIYFKTLTLSIEHGSKLL